MSRLIFLYYLINYCFVLNLILYICFEFFKDYNLKKKSKCKLVLLVKKYNRKKFYII